MAINKNVKNKELIVKIVGVIFDPTGTQCIKKILVV